VVQSYNIGRICKVNDIRKISSKCEFKLPQKPKMKISHTYLQFRGLQKINDMWFNLSIKKGEMLILTLF
jgi:hypothetical protein